MFSITANVEKFLSLRGTNFKIKFRTTNIVIYKNVDVNGLFFEDVGIVRR